MLAVFRAQRQRNQSGTALLDFDSELPRQIIAERSRTHLRDRESTRSNYQHWSGECTVDHREHEAVAVQDFLHPGVRIDPHTGPPAFFFKHVDDVMCRVITKQLSQCLLAIRTVLLLYH